MSIEKHKTETRHFYITLSRDPKSRSYSVRVEDAKNTFGVYRFKSAADASGFVKALAELDEKKGLPYRDILALLNLARKSQ